MNKFIFVVVLYRMDPHESPTIRSLSEQQNLLKERGVHLLILDNTPEIDSRETALDDVRDYISFGENRGLAAAYQVAYNRARLGGYQFMVLLDQDSEVTGAFVRALDGVKVVDGQRVGIWCPKIVCADRKISPFSLNCVGWPTYSSFTNSGRFYGIGSFSVTDIRCLEGIGGFDQFYWLDGLDFWLYERVQRSGWVIRQLDVIVNHDLSLVSRTISFERLKNMALYQSCFIIEFGSAGKIAGMLLRLAVRGLKHVDAIGGARNYASYIHELLKGVTAGLSRRGRRADVE